MQSVTFELPGRRRPYVMAHRGNSAACPENTLAAFWRAFEDGADILETDLHLTRDGVFVCIHDETVDRTTDGAGAVANLTLAEIKQLSASYGRPDFVGERIPTLAELLALTPEDRALALELKTDRFLDPEVARRLVAEVEGAGLGGRFVVISFSLAQIQAVQAVAPHVPVGFITMERATPQPGVQFLGPAWPILVQRPAYVAEAHAAGQLVCPLDVEPESRLALYRELGCDVIMANDSAWLVGAVGGMI